MVCKRYQHLFSLTSSRAFKATSGWNKFSYAWRFVIATCSFQIGTILQIALVRSSVALRHTVVRDWTKATIFVRCQLLARHNQTEVPPQQLCQNFLARTVDKINHSPKMLQFFLVSDVANPLNFILY